MILKVGTDANTTRKNQLYLIAIPSDILKLVGLPHGDDDCLFAFSRRKLTAARARLEDINLTDNELEEVAYLLQHPDYDWSPDELRKELAKLWVKVRHWERRADELMTEKTLIAQSHDRETERYNGMVEDRDKWQGLASDWKDKIDVLEGQHASLIFENNRMGATIAALRAMTEDRDKWQSLAEWQIPKDIIWNLYGKLRTDKSVESLSIGEIRDEKVKEVVVLVTRLITKAQTSSIEAEGKMIAAEQKAEALVSENATIHERCRALEGERETLLAGIITLTKEGKRVIEGLNNELDQQVDHLENTVRATDTQYDGLKLECDKLNAQIDQQEAQIIALKTSVTEQTDNFYRMRNERDQEAEKMSLTENQLQQAQAKVDELTSSNLRRGEKLAEKGKRHTEIVHEMVVRREHLESKLETAKNTIKQKDEQHRNLQDELSNTERLLKSTEKLRLERGRDIDIMQEEQDKLNRQVKAYHTDVKLHEDLMKDTIDELVLWRPVNRFDAFISIFKMTWTMILGVPKSKNRIG